MSIFLKFFFFCYCQDPFAAAFFMTRPDLSNIFLSRQDLQIRFGAQCVTNPGGDEECPRFDDRIWEANNFDWANDWLFSVSSLKIGDVITIIAICLLCYMKVSKFNLYRHSRV